MELNRIPKQGEIYRHFKDKLYQIITVAEHSETSEMMVVYQALYGDFKTYVRPLYMFISEVDRVKYPEVKQQYRFELFRNQTGETIHADMMAQSITQPTNVSQVIESATVANQHNLKEIQLEKQASMQADGVGVVHKAAAPEKEEEVNSLLLKFLDAESYSKKLEVLTSNIKHMSDRLINDMAVSLDCTVDEGPLDQRIQGLIFCLQAMCRFEDRRLR